LIELNNTKIIKEIRNSRKKPKELVAYLSDVIKKEKNNGVKNVYLKALKVIKK